MASDEPSPLLLDAVKASASKFRETKNALESRAKELDAMKAELDAQRAEVDQEIAKLRADQEAFSVEKEQVHAAKASIDRDLAVLRGDREKLVAEEKRLQEWSRVLGEREKAMKDGEDRVKRLEHDFMGQIKDAETKLHNLIEREEMLAQRERSLAQLIDRMSTMERNMTQRESTLTKREEEILKLQAERLAALEAREKEILRLSEEIHSRQRASLEHYESFGELQSQLKEELGRLGAERERLARKERSLMEAEETLSAAMEASGIDFPTESSHLPPPPVDVPRPAPPPPVPVPAYEAPRAPPEVYAPPPEPAPRPKASKAEALGRMTRALETAKRARDTGRNVSEIRKALKLARGAFEAGDYEGAIRLADEILKELEAAPVAK